MDKAEFYINENILLERYDDAGDGEAWCLSDKYEDDFGAGPTYCYKGVILRAGSSWEYVLCVCVCVSVLR